MPNWCSNRLVLIHKNPEMIRKAAEAFESSGLLEWARPVPPDLKRDNVETYASGEEGAQYEALRQENLKNHGYKSWYDWSVDNWGTKWDVQGEILTQTERVLELSFDSAWSPPIAAYAALERQGFEVDALYYEPGCDFAGHYADGEDCCMDVREALDSTLSAELDNTFGISADLKAMESDD